MALKIAVIGGGSTYTPELVNGFLQLAKTLPLNELWLMDIAPERLKIVGGFAQRMVQQKGSPFKVILSTNQRETVTNASYVITQLRVGMMPARISDEYLGKRHGLIGQETTGVGGMAKALRTIPVILSIAYDMRKVAPDGLLINFTNPAGLVTEALFRFAPDVFSVGVCNVGINVKMELLRRIEELTGKQIPPEKSSLDTLGLNHLTWHRGFTADGVDYWPQIIRNYIEQSRLSSHKEWDLDMIECLIMLPNSYLQYYYDTTHKLANQEKWPPSRGEMVTEIEQDLLRQYSDPALIEPPADLMKRGGAYYSTLATQLVDSHFNNRNHEHIVNIRHQGAVEGWPTDWVLEMPCKVDSSGIHPIPTKPLPGVCFGLIAHVKAYELLTVEAAVKGDQNAAYQALLAHPLGPQADQVKAVLEDMLTTNRAYLPQFIP